MVAKVSLGLAALAAVCRGDGAGPVVTASQNASSVPSIAPCPGEDRSLNHTCNIDGGFVCLQVLDEHGKPRNFEDEKDWWDITGQGSVRWDARIRANHGDSWCVGAAAASEVIGWVTCAKIPIRCNATNMEDIFSNDKDSEYKHLQTCLEERCPAEVQAAHPSALTAYRMPQVLTDASTPVVARAPGAWTTLAGALGLLLPAFLVVAGVARHRRASGIRLVSGGAGGEEEDEEEACE
mmetsp:Transcript_52012/g.137394  ORF Transcript_52012/g.137394 Transcript_52012/m.137394 type:complete len:237 (-) Transcript_52012:79-789(-)